MGTNGTEISWDRFQKIWKLLNFRKTNHSTENSENSEMEINWNRNFQEKIFKNLGIPHEVVLFFGNHANSQFSYLTPSELDISRKDDCDAQSNVEIL